MISALQSISVKFFIFCAKLIMPNEFEKVFRKIDNAISKKRTDGVESVEVTQYQWSVLMSNGEFEEQAKKNNANIGGYRIKISENDKFKVNLHYSSQ